MDIENLRAYCLAKRKTSEGFPFDESSLVIKVMDKMFALIDLESAETIALKCNPDYVIELREKYDAIEGAPYFHKKYWIQVKINRDVDDELVRKLIDHSYDEVLNKFTKKQKAEYEADTTE